MKKIISMLMVLVLALGVLAGCTSGANNANNNDSNANEEVSLEGKKIVVGRWGGNESETAAFEKMLEDFTASTGVEVEERIYTDFNTEIQAEIIGGSGPDVFYVDAYMAPFFVNQGILMPLDEADYEMDKFYKALLDTFTLDGKVYALPKDYSTLALYYNKDVVSEEELPTTMEELFGGDFLTELQGKLPEGMISMTYNQDLARNMFIAENGGNSILKDEKSNLSSDEVVNNLSVIYDAAVAGKIKTPADLGFGWNGDAFGNEGTALMIEGNWVIGHLQTNFPELEYGSVEIPTLKDEKGTMTFTVGYGINAATKEVAAATAFVQYATGTEGMKTNTETTGTLPARSDVAEAIGATDKVEWKAHIAGADYATPWQKGTNLETINTEYKNYIPSVVKGERTLKDAMTLADEESNSIIEANQ